MSPDTNQVGRRPFLKSIAASGLAATAVGTAGATPPEHGDDGLRLFSELAVDGAREAVTQGQYAYVATLDGLTIVDWRNPGRPEAVGRFDDDHANGGVLDVKVSGDVAGTAHNDGPGVTFVDVSDPTAPTEAALYEVEGHVHNFHMAGKYAYVGVNQSVENPFSHDRFEIVDLSDPSAPEQVGVWRLRDEYPGFAAGGVSPIHDLYVQDGIAYLAHWDAGTIAVDVSDPSAPTALAQFGEDPRAGEPPEGGFPLDRYYNLPGNAHYVQPSPDGDHVYVGAETFPYVTRDDWGTEDYGGISVFDVTDWDDVEQVAYILPPEKRGENIDFRTSHNFDVTNNRLHTSWYRGGVRVFDITDPSDPVETARYDEGGDMYWTAVQERGFTIGSVIGGGLTFLHADRGSRQPPAFAGDDGRPDDAGLSNHR